MESLYGAVLGVVRFLFKPIIDLITKFLFLKSYQVSTLYRKHKDTRTQWSSSLTDDIELSGISTT